MKSILHAREERVNRQLKLMKTYKKPLLVHRVNMPGAEKNTALSQGIFNTLEAILESCFEDELLYKTMLSSAEGPVMLRVMDIPSRTLKDIAMTIENQHPLGRYVDLDVYDDDEEAISRRAMGKKARPCYICGAPAHECVRTERHSLSELLAAMNNAYEKHKKDKSVTSG